MEFQLKLLHKKLTDVTKLYRICQSMSLFFDGITNGIKSHKRLNRLIKQIFLKEPSMIKIYDEKVFIFKNFFVPLELMTKGELMLLYNLVLTNKIRFLDSEDDVIESDPIEMKIDDKARVYFMYIAKKFYFSVVIVNEIIKQCKQKKLGNLIQNILIEQLAMKFDCIN